MISKVGEFAVGDKVIYDQYVCKITGFPSRNIAKLENLELRPGVWARARASIGRLVKIRFIDDLLVDGYGVESLLADALEVYLRGQGLACKTDANKDGEIDLSIAGHRPVPYVKLRIQLGDGS